MAETYEEWAAAASVPADAETAYDLYLESYEQESRAEFDSGEHDFTDYACFVAAEPPTAWADFYEEWRRDQEDDQASNLRRAAY